MSLVSCYLLSFCNLIILIRIGKLFLREESFPKHVPTGMLARCFDVFPMEFVRLNCLCRHVTELAEISFKCCQAREKDEEEGTLLKLGRKTFII